jgi:hypothetical protein
MPDKCLWNLVKRPDISEFSGRLDCRVFSDNLHFTNSPNASPLIVRSYYDK